MIARTVTSFLALMIIMLLAACDRNNAAIDDPAVEEDNGPFDRVNGRLMGDLTLLGTVAGVDIRPRVSICAQDSPEGQYDPLCTATDSAGDYRVLGIFNRSGLLESQFNDRFGRSRQLFGLYDFMLSGNVADTRSNLTPLGNIASRAYVYAQRGRTADVCFNGELAQSCASALNGGLSRAIATRILDNLSIWLAPIWPEDADESIVSGVYTAETETNPWLALHQTVDLSTRYDEDNDRYVAEARALPVGGTCGDTVVAAVPLSDLTALSLPDTADRLSQNEVDNLLSPCSVNSADNDAETIQVTATPGNGPAPLTTQIAITVPAEADNPPLSAQLMNPRGQVVDAWTVTETELTLADIGHYRIAVTGTLDGRSITGGAAIPVSTSETAQRSPTWGLTGSCRPPDNRTSLINRRNICLEKQDGTIAPPPAGSSQCDALTERPDFVFSPGVCSQTQQYNEPLLGICEQPGTDTRLFHYRDAFSAETARQQHNRLEGSCFGEWRSRLDN